MPAFKPVSLITLTSFLLPLASAHDYGTYNPLNGRIGTFYGGNPAFKGVSIGMDITPYPNNECVQGEELADIPQAWWGDMIGWMKWSDAGNGEFALVKSIRVNRWLQDGEHIELYVASPDGAVGAFGQSKRCGMAFGNLDNFNSVGFEQLPSRGGGICVNIEPDTQCLMFVHD